MFTPGHSSSRSLCYTVPSERSSCLFAFPAEPELIAIFSTTPNLPTNIIPTKIAWPKLPGNSLWASEFPPL